MTEDHHLDIAWQQEELRLRRRLNFWAVVLTAILYPGTLIDYSLVAPGESTLFVSLRLLPSIVVILAGLIFYLCKIPNQWLLYLTICCTLTASTYRPSPEDMGNFVFINACCLILMSAIPLIAFWQSIILFAYLVVINIVVYLVFYADQVPLPQSGLVFTSALGVMLVVVLRLRYEIIRRNFFQSKQLSTQNNQINDQKLQLEILNQSLREKNQMLLDSLSYAQNIQTLLLPRLQDIQTVFPESFVFFKPRHQVSGDFYWFHQVDQSSEAILVVMDCTGHGVPGALISMIGESLLKQVVIKERIHAPHQILNRLHQGIRQTLRQKESLNRDGMDMGVVQVNFATKQLHYAGARNTLVYFQEGKMQQIKGDLYSIGGEQRETQRVFTSHTIDIYTPITFYLFSDGYQDQFGGQAGKKFMRQQFRNTLKNIYGLPMPTQFQRLQEILQQWQGNHEQVDDILIVGVKINEKIFNLNT